MKRYVLKKNGITMQLLTDRERPVELHCCEDSQAPAVGQVMIARVKDVVSHIGAAFVDIGQEKNAYLPLSDVSVYAAFTKKNSKKTIASGDEIIVQIVKEPMGTKPYCVSTKISLSGKAAVVVADGRKMTGVSKKIRLSEEQKNRIDAFSAERTEDFSLIIRTNAASMEEQECLDEMEKLWDRLAKLMSGAVYRACLSVLDRPIPLWMSLLRDTPMATLEEIVTDDADLYEELLQNKEELGLLSVPITRYDDRYPLQEKLSLRTICQEAAQTRVWMKSGAYLIIEQTEALVSIDVNSGKAEKKTSAEEFYLKINQEAARTAAEQIRLRNLSGIILIDFINMKSEEDRQTVTDEFRKAAASDPIRSTVAGFTKLGLMEITRTKKYKPFARTEWEKFF